MLKALIRKQLKEYGAFLYMDRKNGKRRSKASAIGYGLLLIVAAASLMGNFSILAFSMCETMVELGLDWFYFAIMGMFSLVVGVFGSIFITYSGIYQAKDNEMLLAMPIPPFAILTGRVLGIYLMGLVYESIVQIPAIAVYIRYKGFVPSAILTAVLMAFVLAAAALCLSLILGYAVAWIAVRVRNKSMVTVLVSLVGIGLYYYYYAKGIGYLEEMLMRSEEVALQVKEKGYLLYAYGKACSGSWGHFGIVVLGTAVCTMLIFFLLSRTYLKIVMDRRGEKKKIYRETRMKSMSVGATLLKKEWKRFTSSAGYMLNCGLGMMYQLVIAGGLIIKKEMILGMTMMAGLTEYLPLIAAGMVCTACSMNDISAPSVSLEGKSLWILQSMPVDPWDILKAKLRLHLRLGMTTTLICAAAVIWALPLGAGESILVMLAAIVYSLFGAVFGMVLGLIFPNLHWTNEIVVIKQGAAVSIALLGSMALVLLLGGVYYLLRSMIQPTVYLVICEVILVAVDVLMVRWIRVRGTRILTELS